MRASSLAAFVVVAAAAACQPFALEGESCDGVPCAAGLICDADSVCAEPPPPPPPPCVDDAECVVDGDASGRVCDAGVCRFADCAFDVQCGTRICVSGQCAPAEACLEDGDCSAIDGVGQLCINNQCRPPCFADDDCGAAVGGIGLQTCVDGRCQQRCLGDFTCLGGGICDNGSCRDPECTVETASDDCDATQFCETGRCTPFTSCAVDDDCFDANLFCDTGVEPVRCAERPACRADNECGLSALCLDRHCRPAEGCFVDADCTDPDDECVGTRCVRRPECRATDDCDNGQVCADLRCVNPPTPEAPAFVVVEDGLAPCDGICTRVVFVGEQLRFATRGFDDGGLPVAGEIRPNFTGLLSIAESANNVVVVEATAAGTGTVSFGAATIFVTAVAPTAGLDVIVAQREGNGVVDGASVVVGSDSVVADEFGVASFAAADPAAESVVVTFGAHTVVVPRDGDRDLRVLMPTVTSTTRAAALQVQVDSTGDETGPVGVGVALPSPASFVDVDFARLFGDVVQGQANLPVIGALPVALPSSMTLEASLPLIGDQIIRPLAEVEVPGGPSFVFALEDRREQQDLVQLALNGDPIGLGLDFAEQSEGMDAALVAGGVVSAVDRVTDDADRDGDGDTSELIPNYAAAPVVEARPFGPPRQRTSILAAPPAGANERALVAVGVQLPGHFIIGGTGVIRGATGFEDTPLPEPVKLIPQSPSTLNAPQVVVVTAVFNDTALRSRAQVIAAGVDAIVDIGPLLDPPEGAFLLRDVPADGDISVVLPAIDADLIRLELVRDVAGNPETVELYARGDGAVRLPAGFDTAALISVTAFDLGGSDAFDTVFASGSGPVDVSKRAAREAAAPAQ